MGTNPPGRETAERRSAAPLLYLRQLPPWTVPVLSAVLLVAGLAIRGPGGAVALALLVLLLGWLACLSWPRLNPAGRMVRVLLLAALAALAVWHAMQ
jgi:hypothetical protein